MSDKMTSIAVIVVLIVLSVPLTYLNTYFLLILRKKVGYVKWLLGLIANTVFYILIIFFLTEGHINTFAFFSLILLNIIVLFLIRNHIEHKLKSAKR